MKNLWRNFSDDLVRFLWIQIFMIFKKIQFMSFAAFLIRPQ